jgi:hypothetical protein
MLRKTLASRNYVNQVYSNYGLKEDGGSKIMQAYGHNGDIVRKIWVKEVRKREVSLLSEKLRYLWDQRIIVKIGNTWMTKINTL